MQDTFIFVDQSRDFYAALIRGIYSSRAQILFAATFSEMFRLIPTVTNPFIIIGLPADGTDQAVINQFLKLSKLDDLSIVFIGKDIQRLEATIAEVVPSSITLNVPTTSDDVLGAVEYLRSRQKASGASVARAEAETARDSRGDWQRPSRKEPFVSALSKLCFQALKTLDSGTKDIEFSPIFRAQTFEDLARFSYFPKNLKVKALAEAITSAAGKRGAAHLHRTAAVSTLILDTLQMEAEVLEVGRNVAFLFASELVKQPHLVTADYLLPSRVAMRRQIAELIMQSAEQVGSELKLKNEKEIIITISRLLGDDCRAGDTTGDIVSSTIMTTDMVDRLCWQNNHWDPKGVHTLMHRFLTEDMPDIHPKVLALTLKNLCQALEGMGASLLRARWKTKNPTGSFTDLSAESAMLTGEGTVALSCLMPGMRTTRSVVTFDGRVIVSPDTLLDEDIIWRLWQLAAVRPLNPVHIAVG